MSKPAIIVDGISKQYRIGLKERPHQTFREAATGVLAAPLRRLRRMGAEADDKSEFYALKDVSFEVRPGEVVGIIGRNGAGKSTLLKILSRITEPTSGEIRLRGRVASLLEIGTGFHPELTGRENIYLNGSILGMKRAEITRKFDEIVDFSGVEKFLDTPVKHYSSGMYVRLAFAVAAHLEPEILIVDEVLAVGDAEFQRKCLGKMQQVSEGEGRTVLFVSHNVGAVEQLCTKALLLDEGVVSSQGETETVLEVYLQQAQRLAATSYEATVSDNADLMLLRAHLLDAAGNESDRVRFGEPFTLRMVWRQARPIGGVGFFVRIYDAHHRFLTAVNTLNSDGSLNEGNGMHELLCKFDPNLFVPGEYSLTIAAAVRPHILIATYENCISLVIDDIAYDPVHRFTIDQRAAFSARARWSNFGIETVVSMLSRLFEQMLAPGRVRRIALVLCRCVDNCKRDPTGPLLPEIC